MVFTSSKAKPIRKLAQSRSTAPKAIKVAAIWPPPPITAKTNEIQDIATKANSDFLTELTASKNNHKKKSHKNNNIAETQYDCCNVDSPITRMATANANTRRTIFFFNVFYLTPFLL